MAIVQDCDSGIIFGMVECALRFVSLHHGDTLHQSSSNTSSRPRRAVAIHYLRHDAKLVRPALPFDESYWVAFD